MQRAMANLAIRQGDMQALQDAASQIVALEPASPEGYAMRAESYLRRRQFSDAEQDVRKAIDVAPQSAAGYIEAGSLRNAQKKFPDAERAYQQALDRDPRSLEALSGLINSYLEQQQIDRALAAANTQIGETGGSSAFYDLLGSVLLTNKKDFSAAEAALKKSIELDPKNSDAMVKLGQALSSEGKIDEAITLAERYLQENPRDAGFCVFSGELYESKQDWAKAQTMYQKALDLAPDNPIASNNLAAVIVRTGGNLNLALSLAQSARRNLPESPDIADTLGWVYYTKGIYDSSVDMFQEALKLGAKNNRPEGAAFHYHLGLAYQKTGKAALARREWEKALKVDPKFQDAGQVKQLLAELK